MTNSSPVRPSLLIVTPATRASNNGNWQTAVRWARMLADGYRVRVLDAWRGEAGDALIALHARRSAPSIAAWTGAHPQRPPAVVLTGTDLYRDIHSDPAAQRSLDIAGILVTLQDRGPLALPETFRGRTRVIYQSATMRKSAPKTRRHLRVVAAGHLREEKAPDIVFAAARRLSPGEGILIDHLGAALDPRFGKAARATMAACAHYRWLGALDHDTTRRRIQRAHLLLHPSRLEGGAHVIMEAACSGTPVLASRMDGNLGMLGESYDGYFAPDNVDELVKRLHAARAAQAQRHGWLDRLTRQCEQRACLFEPRREAAALHRLAIDLLRQ